ncbi:alkaline phosphatase D family protein [Rhodovarius crocodyli]|nr:alkaline phosphatase D family protein [Rhodovarius crocodyli]
MHSADRHILHLHRRGLLTGALALTALATQPGCVALAQEEGLFGLGVASGDPWPDSVVLWTRLTPRTPEPVPLRWEIAADDGFRQVVARGEAVAGPDHGHAVHVIPTGLQPGRHYWYRFTAQGQTSRVGRTRTAPAPDADVPVRFVNASCQRYEHGYFTAWRHAAADDALDFVFFNGDYIYEYGHRAVGASPLIARAVDGPECVTLDQYRARYAQYRRDADLQAVHAAHPFIVTFDDHEVQNNWVSDIPSVPQPAGVEFALRKAAAFRAWYENMPVRPAALPRGPDITAYRRLVFGRQMALHVLDTRSFRDDQPCGDGRKQACEAVHNPAAQVMGSAQEAWLFDSVRNGAAMQVLGQQIFMATRPYPGDQFSMDSWDGYPAARSRVMQGLRDRGIANPIVLTGDVHRAWAGLVTAGDRALGTEFVATSIASDGDGRDADAGALALIAAHPHLRFHSARRGYTRHEAARGRMTAEYLALPYVSRPGAEAAPVAKLMTEARAPGIIPA